MDDDEINIIKMIKNGARGYLLKDIHPDELKIALKEVLSEGFYHTKHVSKALQNSMHHQHDLKQSLSSNELRFLKLACTERTYKEIAEEMNLSPKTIDGYRDTLFKKMGIKSRTGLVIFAVKNGYFEV